MAKIIAYTPLYMASTSIFRRRMMEEVQLPCTFKAPLDEEDDIKFTVRELPFETQAKTLAAYKGKTLSIENPDVLILSSDQMAICEGIIYSKPKDEAEALAHLMSLSGREVQLYTAAVLQQNGKVVWSHVETPKVQMRSFTAEEAEIYLKLDPEALYCCGACKLEGVGRYLVESLSGDPYTVQGMPMSALIGFLLSKKYIEMVSA